MSDLHNIDPSSQATTETELIPKSQEELDSAKALELAQSKQARLDWLNHSETKKVFVELEKTRQAQLINIEENAYKWTHENVLVAIENARTSRKIIENLKSVAK